MSPKLRGIRAKEIENEVLQNDYCLISHKSFFPFHNTDGLMYNAKYTRDDYEFKYVMKQQVFLEFHK
jgi:hypothetical protein